MKVLAFGASNSSESINRKLASYAANKISNAQVTLLDLNDFEMPLFSVDREKAAGIPKLAHDFYQLIGAADLLVVSFAEHNGSYTAAYKNLFDWTSRISKEVFQHKDMLMLSTSPGPGGAKSVLAAAENSAPFFTANVVGAISLPSFNDNFDLSQNAVTSDSFNQKLQTLISTLN